MPDPDLYLYANRNSLKPEMHNKSLLRLILARFWAWCVLWGALGSSGVVCGCLALFVRTSALPVHSHRVNCSISQDFSTPNSLS